MEEAVKYIDRCDELCREIGLPIARLHIRDVRGILDLRTADGTRVVVAQSSPKLTRAASVLASNIEKELSLLTFFTIPPDKTRYLRAFSPEADPVDIDSIEPLATRLSE